MVAGYYIGRGKLTYEIGANAISNAMGLSGTEFLNKSIKNELPENNKPTNEQVDSLCVTLGDTAEIIMSARQTEVPISKLMANIEIASAKVGMTDDFKNATRNLIISAYESAAFSTQEYRDKAIREFRSTQETACYRTMSRQ
jgi:hypothetical protein